jgi:CheY-like chemotaxis protein
MAILIVDDSRDEQELLTNRLQAAGYESLVVADSAEAAFAIVSEGGQRAGGVDLILMDIMLPGVDGLEACRRITSTEWLQDIPIIVVTGTADTLTPPVACLLRKPTTSEELLKVVRRCTAAGSQTGSVGG